jgi:amidohydrolase
VIEREELDVLAEPTQAILDEVVDTRRHLHRHPEIGFEETGTTHLIRRRLEELGLTLHDCPTETGAVAELAGERPGKTVMLRADIDALPIQEESGVEFASSYDGFMHACGHDSHTAMLLGVARMLAEHAEALPGRYLFIFQPAEEIVEGAKAMLAGGLFEAHHPDFALGLHVSPFFDTGTVLARPGLQWGGSDAFELLFHGPGGHGGLIRRQGNVVAAQAFFLERMHTIVEGLEADGSECHVNVGDVRTDGLWNVVPRHVWLQGSLRTFDKKLREEALTRFKALLLETETEFDVECRLKLVHGTVPMINHPTAWETVMEAGREVVGDGAVTLDRPLTVSDDMAEFMVHVPGCYFNLGARPPELETPPSLHQSTMRMDEAAMGIGVRVLGRSAIKLASRS